MEVHVFLLLKKSREHSRTFEKKTGNARFLLIHYFQLSAMLRLMKYNTSKKKLQCLELVLRSMLREERVFLSVFFFFFIKVKGSEGQRSSKIHRNANSSISIFRSNFGLFSIILMNVRPLVDKFL